MYSKCINLFKINRIDNWLAQCELSLLLPAYMCSCFNSFIHSFIQYWNQIVIFGLFLVEEKSLSLRMLSSFILICRNQSTVELSEATFVLTQPSGHKRIARSVGSLTQANFTFESHTHTHYEKEEKKWQRLMRIEPAILFILFCHCHWTHVATRCGLVCYDLMEVGGGSEW